MIIENDIEHDHLHAVHLWVAIVEPMNLRDLSSSCGFIAQVIKVLHWYGRVQSFESPSLRKSLNWVKTAVVTLNVIVKMSLHNLSTIHRDELVVPLKMTSPSCGFMQSFWWLERCTVQFRLEVR